MMCWSSKGRRGKRWNVMSGLHVYIDLNQEGLDVEVCVELTVSLIDELRTRLVKHCP